MKIRRVTLTIISIALTLALLSCRGPSVTTAVPTLAIPKLSENPPDIRGTIAEIYTQNTNIGGLFVEGKKEVDTSYDKAHVGITKDTRVFIKEGGTYVTTTVADLKLGQIVEVLFADPILTSDPVQANAAEVVILQ